MFNERGMTLAEIAVASLIAASVLMGLAIVYLFGMDAWLLERSRMDAQNAAGRAVYAVTQAALGAEQSGASVAAGGTELILPQPRATGPTSDTVTIALNGGVLEAKGFRSWRIPERSGDSLVVLPPDTGNLFDIVGTTVHFSFRVAATRREAIDTIEFSTDIAMRNL